MNKNIFNEKEAANYIGVSVSYLQHDRCDGFVDGRTPGPDYLKIGKRVRYRKDDLDRWLESHKVSRVT